MSIEDRKDEWKRLKEHNERMSDIKRWKAGDWRKNALSPPSQYKNKNKSGDEELWHIIRVQRLQLIISVGFNVILVWQLLKLTRIL